jgi:hypothetical protein
MRDDEPGASSSGRELVPPKAGDGDGRRVDDEIDARRPGVGVASQLALDWTSAGMTMALFGGERRGLGGWKGGVRGGREGRLRGEVGRAFGSLVFEPKASLVEVVAGADAFRVSETSYDGRSSRADRKLADPSQH